MKFNEFIDLVKQYKVNMDSDDIKTYLRTICNHFDMFYESKYPDRFSYKHLAKAYWKCETLSQSHQNFGIGEQSDLARKNVNLIKFNIKRYFIHDEQESFLNHAKDNVDELREILGE